MDHLLRLRARLQSHLRKTKVELGLSPSHEMAWPIADHPERALAVYVRANIPMLREKTGFETSGRTERMR